MAKKYDFTENGDCGCGNHLEQGATFLHTITWKKEDSLGVEVPVDLTGYSAKMQIRKKPSDPLIFEFLTSNSRITLGGASGDITLIATAAETDVLPAGLYKYDLELTSPSAVVTRLIEGSFEIKAQISL